MNVWARVEAVAVSSLASLLLGRWAGATLYDISVTIFPDESARMRGGLDYFRLLTAWLKYFRYMNERLKALG